MACSVEACSGAVKAKGVCSKHYQRLLKYGDPLGDRTLTQRPLDERFWEKVDRNGPILNPDLGPCWVWTAHRTTKGYGQIGIGADHLVRAHRLAYELTYGPIPEGLLVRHRCDNPPCVRPEHLELGTDADNSADMVKRGRSKKPATLVRCVHGHEYTPENTYRDKRGFRACVTCRVQRTREWRRAKREEARRV